MTDLATRIIGAARAAWANDYIDAIESDRDVAAYIRQALAIASGPIEADATRRYGAMFNQDAGFILTNGIRFLFADSGEPRQSRDPGGNEATDRLVEAQVDAHGAARGSCSAAMCITPRISPGRLVGFQTFHMSPPL